MHRLTAVPNKGKARSSGHLPGDPALRYLFGGQACTDLCLEYQLSDKMQEQARFAVVNRYTERQIRENFQGRPGNWKFRPNAESITVSASNAIVKISMEYTVPVDLFFYHTDLHFAPSSENKALF